MDGTQNKNSRSHSLQRGERNRHDPAFNGSAFYVSVGPVPVLCFMSRAVSRSLARVPRYEFRRAIYGLRGAWTHDESVRQPRDECLLCNLRALSIIARFAGSKRMRTAFTIEPTEISDTESYHIRLSEVTGSMSNRNCEASN